MTDVRNIIHSFAYGDAWGFVTEFEQDMNELLLHEVKFPDPALISDDTQMHLYMMYAVQEILTDENLRDALLYQSVLPENSQSIISEIFTTHYLKWMDDEDNAGERAPGSTCLLNLSRKAHERGQVTSWDAHIAQMQKKGFMKNKNFDYSLGCGANMRAGWLGLLDIPLYAIFNLAVIQSAVTHRHPRALASAALTALLVSEIRKNPNANVFAQTLELTEYLKDSELAGQYGNEVAHAFKEMGDTISQSVIPDTDYYMTTSAHGTPLDPCVYFGEGWVADEAFYNALALTSIPDEVQTPYERLTALVHSSGDSDSIAAIGAMFMAAKGAEFPPEWVLNLEPRYRAELTALSDWVEAFNRSQGQ